MAGPNPGSDRQLLTESDLQPVTKLPRMNMKHVRKWSQGYARVTDQVLVVEVGKAQEVRPDSVVMSWQKQRLNGKHLGYGPGGTTIWYTLEINESLCTTLIQILDVT